MGLHIPGFIKIDFFCNIVIHHQLSFMPSGRPVPLGSNRIGKSSSQVRCLMALKMCLPFTKIEQPRQSSKLRHLMQFRLVGQYYIVVKESGCLEIQLHTSDPDIAT